MLETFTFCLKHTFGKTLANHSLTKGKTGASLFQAPLRSKVTTLPQLRKLSCPSKMVFYGHVKLQGGQVGQNWSVWEPQNETKVKRKKGDDHKWSVALLTYLTAPKCMIQKCLCLKHKVFCLYDLMQWPCSVWSKGVLQPKSCGPSRHLGFSWLHAIPTSRPTFDSQKSPLRNFSFNFNSPGCRVIFKKQEDGGEALSRAPWGTPNKRGVKAKVNRRTWGPCSWYTF